MIRRPNLEWAVSSIALSAAALLLLVAGNSTHDLIYYVLSSLWWIGALLTLDYAWKLGRDE